MSPLAAPSELDQLLAQIRACRLCEASLPLEPKPVLRASATATLLVVGQAPGTLVHGSGIPWNDASGMRLRDWLRIDRDSFYDESRVAIVPMGFAKSEAVRDVANALYAELGAAGIDVFLDDRDERPGSLLADNELIGTPHRVVIGDRGLKEGVVEYQGRRDAEAAKLAVADVAATLIAKLKG